ncbi:hypothetical protein [Nitrosococcus oceani]|uniref:hypothetical protein n=1 Tax=Nitrosococcus oceani TaxID=1229 RepID=UPI00211CA901|nr:hypothetical protein [Nitrosococcus oceani]
MFGFLFFEQDELRDRSIIFGNDNFFPFQNLLEQLWEMGLRFVYIDLNDGEKLGSVCD